jgi:16S rRNA (guanine527-N7)-methyltransferase
MASAILSQPLLEGLSQLGLTPSPEQLRQLALYKEALLEANARMNLVAASTVPNLDLRHILDSAQLVKYVYENNKEILDVGAGAGLPGLVLATLLPGHHVTLAEKVGKKAAFLASTASFMGLRNVTVHPARVELLPRASFDLITCRAFASLSGILKLTTPLLRKNGMWLLLKGESFDVEFEASPEAKKMTIERHQSITSGTGVVVRLAPKRP